MAKRTRETLSCSHCSTQGWRVSSGENGVIERREQLLLIVIVDDGADEAERLDAFVDAEIVQDVEGRGMNRGGARVLMQDVTFVEQRDVDAGAAEDEADDQPHRAAARDDDPCLACHLEALSQLEFPVDLDRNAVRQLGQPTAERAC